MLERAILCAVRWHAGQVDWSGMPCILHPLRVMLRMTDETAMTAAVLHDVVENCGVSLDDLRAEGFPEEVVGAVDAITRRADEGYEDYVRRAAAHPIARRIKVADLRDNLERSLRQPAMPENDARVRKYQRALEIVRGEEELTRDRNNTEPG